MLKTTKHYDGPVDVTIPHLDIHRKKACQVYKKNGRILIWWDENHTTSGDGPYGYCDVDAGADTVTLEI